MTLDQLLQTVEARIFSMGKRLWRDDAATQARDQADHLSEQLRERMGTLNHCRESIRQTRGRLVAKQKQESFLAERIETYFHVADQVQAWQLALELDAVRRAVRRDRELLRHLEKAERNQRQHIRRLDQSLAALHEKLYLIP